MSKYYYYTKGTFYFRKLIHPKYLKDKNQYFNFRMSLRRLSCSYYFLIENNELQLTQLSNFINERLNLLLSHTRSKLSVENLIEYLYEIFDIYKKENFENVDIKKQNRLIETNPFNNKFQTLAITYKRILNFNNLQNPKQEEIFEIGHEILKRSNITKEQLLTIKPSQMISFYTMLIETEKTILENDIKIYIANNIQQFSSLIIDINKSIQEKITNAYYEVIEIIKRNEPKANYIEFIKSKRTLPISTKINQSNNEIFDMIINSLKEEDILNTSLCIDSLIDKFLSFKKVTQKKEKAYRRSLKLFKSFLQGDGRNYKTLTLQELTESNFADLEKILINLPATTKSKVFENLNIFELVKLRKQQNSARYATNTLALIENHIKQFWNYLCTYHKNLGLDRDLISIMNCEYTSNNIKEELGEEDPTLRAFTLSEINQFISFVYKPKDLKKTLLNSPRNFYLFIFALLCGTRQEEALLIAMDDIKVQEINGKRYFYIFLNQDKPYQHLKNKNAHRNIPITDLMIDLGLLNYIQIRHNRDYTTLFDFSNTGGSAARTFFSRNLQKLFPKICDTRENRNSRLLDNYVQFRSFRKNFSNFLFEENRSKYDTHENKLRIMGHEHEGSNKVTKHYLGRLEPQKAYDIMNAISYEGIDFTNIKQIIKEHYGEIKKDLYWIKETIQGEWNKESRIKTKKGRRI